MNIKKFIIFFFISEHLHFVFWDCSNISSIISQKEKV